MMPNEHANSTPNTQAKYHIMTPYSGAGSPAPLHLSKVNVSF